MTREVLTVLAQTLYNLRMYTGFISGEDLSKFFASLPARDPSPSGYDVIPVSSLSPFGTEAKTALAKSFKMTVPEMGWYILGPAEEGMSMRDSILRYAIQPTHVVLDAIRKEFGKNDTPITETMVQVYLYRPMSEVTAKISPMLGITPGFHWD